MYINHFFATLLIAMLPVVELRAGLPYGIAAGLDYPVALIAAVVGNLIPVPFIIVYVRKLFKLVREYWTSFDSAIRSLEERAHLKGRIVKKYSFLGLVLLVAIPLPGTGAWTGALVAAMLDIRLKKAFPAILLGVLIAAAIMTAVTYGVLGVL